MSQEMENTPDSTVEGLLEHLKRLLEGNIHNPESFESTTLNDQCPELTESVAELQRKIEDFTALKDLQQRTTMTKQKDLEQILRESHEGRVQQITNFLQDNKEFGRRMHREMLTALARQKSK
ncbi:hypothetical protein APHAL10511_002539 [Amanita phalloides]|nr:hypothetical protein APHAL10511_002539 [Amanita phalloides]